MKKETSTKVVNLIPTILSNSLSYFKANFDKNVQDALGSAGGTVGIIIKLFGQPVIDKYFQKQTAKKLEDFGSYTYLKAGFGQAEESLKEIEATLDADLKPDDIAKTIDKIIMRGQLSVFKPADILLIFQPKYHPLVLFVKNNYIQILREIRAAPAEIKTFQKHFNENIESQVAKAFGDDYDKHLAQTEKFRLKDNETNLLWAMLSLGRIGFRETEDLKYEATFAQWKKVSALREKDKKDLSDDENEKQEQSLQPIEELIEQYFGRPPANHLEKILFIVADFGKGKSVFLRHYAAELARKYLETGEGPIPVYFNLRNFKHYSSEPKLGVISDYLETEYSIKIDSDYFKKKRYVFLLDALDESGELNKTNIDRVMSSLRRIQGLDKTLCKTNRLIITSRPFDDGLSEHLRSHRPHSIENKEGREIEYFIASYGFTKAQFNEWLLDSLKQAENFTRRPAKGLAGQISESFKTQAGIDPYQELLAAKTLSRSELRRPIFAYMIYQLIINNVDFSTLGKIGVYLSFINLLSKDAKHIHDINYRLDLADEFKFRSILHATAALWMQKRQQGKQGALKKADICRALEGEKKQNESDKQILARFKDQGVVEIQFLSHSYFGENDNMLHFQHQSFAEILLAEYYLKVFIKYALDEEFDVEAARVKLILGEPTEQAAQFFRELLKLLRETAVEEATGEIIEKRKLLFPLLASLANKKHNQLFCNDLYYTWYKSFEIPENRSEYPLEALKNWGLDRGRIAKIVKLARAILESKTNYVLAKATAKTALYDNEVLAIQNNKLADSPPDMDRWLALLAGNILYNDIDNERFFNGTIKNYEHLFDLIRNWNYAFGLSAPLWGRDLFVGINMQPDNEGLNLSHLNFRGLDFSYSIFNNFTALHASFWICRFNNATFNQVTILQSDLYDARFQDIRSINRLRIELCDFGSGLLIPKGLYSAFLGDIRLVNFGDGICTIGIDEGPFDSLNDLFLPLEGLLIYGLKKQLFTIADIKTWFRFEREDEQVRFFEKVETLKEFEGAGEEHSPL